MARRGRKPGPKPKTKMQEPSTTVVGFESTIRSLLRAGSPEFNTALFVVRNFEGTMKFTPRAIRGKKIDLELIRECYPELMKLEGIKGVEEAVSLFRFMEDQSPEWGADINYSVDDASTPEQSSPADGNQPESPSKGKKPGRRTTGKRNKRSADVKATDKVDKRRQGSVAEKVIQRFGKGVEKTALANLETALAKAGSPAKLAKVINAKGWGFDVSAANLYFIIKRLRERYSKGSK